MRKQIEVDIAVARMRAAAMWPYARSYIMSMITVETDKVPTMATDCYLRLYYNPEFVKTLTPDEAATVVMHEFFHCFLSHDIRAKAFIGKSVLNESEATVWNLAADCAINCYLIKMGGKLPDGCVLPSQFGLKGNLLTEDYYKAIRDQMEDDDESGSRPSLDEDGDGADDGEGEGEGDGNDGGGGGGGKKTGKVKGPISGSSSDGQQRPWEHGSPEGVAESDSKDDGELATGKRPPGLTEDRKERIKGHVAQKMAEAQRSTGNLPAGLWREVKEILKPSKDPREVLRYALRTKVSSIPGPGYANFRRENRRLRHQKARLPSQVQPVPNVVLIVDTSGSMAQDDLGLALGVIHGILNTLPNQNGVTVICGDTQAESVGKVFRANQLLSPSTNAYHSPNSSLAALVGGGGTDMGLLVKGAAKLTPRPDLIIVCSDGYTPWCSDVGIPTVAALTRKTQHSVPDWIQAIYMGENE